MKKNINLIIEFMKRWNPSPSDNSDLLQIMLINITNDKITLIPNFKSSTRRQINLI